MSLTGVLYSNNSHCVLRTPTNEFYSLEDIAMTPNFLYNLQRSPSAECVGESSGFAGLATELMILGFFDWE